MESKLIAQVQANGDETAFAQLMKRTQSPVRQFLRRLLQNNHAIADELAQETFLKAYLHISTYRSEGKFLSWLFKIAYQLFVAHTRKKEEQNGVELPESIDHCNWQDQFEAKKSVQAMMKCLEPQERAILQLYFSHELSHSEIAPIMGLPLGSVKTIIRRSRLKLQSLAEKLEKGATA